MAISYKEINNILTLSFKTKFLEAQHWRTLIIVT